MSERPPSDNPGRIRGVIFTQPEFTRQGREGSLFEISITLNVLEVPLMTNCIGIEVGK